MFSNILFTFWLFFFFTSEGTFSSVSTCNVHFRFLDRNIFCSSFVFSWKDLRSYFFYIIEHRTVHKVSSTVRGTHFKIPILLRREKIEFEDLNRIQHEKCRLQLKLQFHILLGTESVWFTVFAICFVIFFLIVRIFLFVELP